MKKYCYAMYEQDRDGSLGKLLCITESDSESDKFMMQELWLEYDNHKSLNDRKFVWVWTPAEQDVYVDSEHVLTELTFPFLLEEMFDTED